MLRTSLLAAAVAFFAACGGSAAGGTSDGGLSDECVLACQHLTNCNVQIFYGYAYGYGGAYALGGDAVQCQAGCRALSAANRDRISSCVIFAASCNEALKCE